MKLENFGLRSMKAAEAMIQNLWACFVTNIIGSDALGIISGSEIGVALVLRFKPRRGACAALRF